MKRALSVFIVMACMLCMVTACEKNNKNENDTSASQVSEAECMDAVLVTTEPEGEITISELINQRIEEDGKIYFYWKEIPSDTPVEITEDSMVNILSYDGAEITDYGNRSNLRFQTRLGDIIHNKVDYSTYDIGQYSGNWESYDNKYGDEKYIEEEGYVQLEITTDDSTNNTQMETLYLHSYGTLYTRNAGSEEWDQKEKDDSLPMLPFGTFERIRLDGETYMTFCVKNNLNLIEYVIIPDNEFTKNKTVVYDTPGTEGTATNTVDFLKKYQTIPKEELEQLIVPSDSKKDESSQTEK
ncbi:hypothetical protein [Agathobacter sp.]